MENKLKPCPFCGHQPLGLTYTCNPPKFGYQHCEIHGGYNDSWSEARDKWNELVKSKETFNLHNRRIVDTAYATLNYQHNADIGKTIPNCQPWQNGISNQIKIPDKRVMQTTESMKRRIAELESQRKAISKEIRKLKTTVWQREHYKLSINEKAIVRQTFGKSVKDLTPTERKQYDNIRQTRCRRRKDDV